MGLRKALLEGMSRVLPFILLDVGLGVLRELKSSNWANAYRSETPVNFIQHY